MGITDAWNKFMKSGNVKDYLDYRKEIEGSNGVLNPAKEDIFGVNNENSNKWHRNPRGGLWGK